LLWNGKLLHICHASLYNCTPFLEFLFSFLLRQGMRTIKQLIKCNLFFCFVLDGSVEYLQKLRIRHNFGKVRLNRPFDCGEGVLACLKPTKTEMIGQRLLSFLSLNL